MNEPIVYLNGEFTLASKAKLDIFDLGIVLGATLTEMTRTFRQTLFRAEDHIARLYRSLKFAEIAVPMTPAEMLAKTRELTETNCRLLNQDTELGVVHKTNQEKNR